MSEGVERGTRRTILQMNLREGEMLVSGVAVLLLVDAEGERHLRKITLNNPESWEQVGWLQGAFDSAREKLKRSWGDLS